MRYNIFDGGNELRHFDDYTSAFTAGTQVRPANHHVDRHKTILFHVNTGARPFTAEHNPLVVRNADEIATHAIGAGWMITGVGFHVKQAGVGTLRPVVILGNGTVVNLLNYNATLPQAGQGGSAVVPGYATTGSVALNTLGYTMFRPANGLVREVLNPSGVGYISIRFDAGGSGGGGDEPTPEIVLSGCFGVILQLTHLEDERECDCVTTPCPTVFPDPLCTPSI